MKKSTKNGTLYDFGGRKIKTGVQADNDAMQKGAYILGGKKYVK